MKTFLIVLLIALLVTILGCSANDIPLAEIKNEQAVIAVGSLANANDPYDIAAAPIITKTTLTRISSTRATKHNLITKDQAKSILTCTDATIDNINQSQKHKDMNGMMMASRMADNCRADFDKFRGTK